MNRVVKLEIPVDEETARALTDVRQLEAIGRFVDRIVRPQADDPLGAVLEAASAEAKSAGLTQDDLTAELEAYNAENRVAALSKRIRKSYDTRPISHAEWDEAIGDKG